MQIHLCPCQIVVSRAFMSSSSAGVTATPLKAVEGTLDDGRTWRLTKGSGGLQLKVPAKGKQAKLHRLHGGQEACVSRAADILLLPKDQLPTELQQLLLRPCIRFSDSERMNGQYCFAALQPPMIIDLGVSLLGIAACTHRWLFDGLSSRGGSKAK